MNARKTEGGMPGRSHVGEKNSSHDSVAAARKAFAELSRTIEETRLAGAAQARHWIKRSHSRSLSNVDLAAWRANCRADAVRENELKNDCMLILAEWESAFDSVILEAEAASQAGRDPAPAHEAFSWMPGCSYSSNGDFAEKTLDICRGIELCLQLAQSSGMAHRNSRDASPENKEVPTLSEPDAETLVLFAKTAAAMLGERASDVIDSLWRKESGNA